MSMLAVFNLLASFKHYFVKEASPTTNEPSDGSKSHAFYPSCTWCGDLILANAQIKA